MSVDYTSRLPNFQNDVYTYGKIGERYFLNAHGRNMYNKGYTVYDVTNERFWQDIDIDFVVTKGEKKLENNWDCVNNKVFGKIEVKVDTRAHDTGNIPFEAISHGNFGWCYKTKADYVYYVLCKDGIVDGKLYAYNVYLIDMKKWHIFASDARNSFRRPNCIRNEEIYDFLHKIEDLKSSKVIVDERAINAWI